MGVVEVLIRKLDATEQEADVVKAKIANLSLPSDWSVSVRYIEYRVVEK